MRKPVKNLDYFKHKFIQKANLRHNYRYLYSEIDYVNSITKVKVMCKTHGPFLVRPDAHIRKVGCPACNGGRLYSCETFVEKATLKHKGKYDYSKTRYINSFSKIIITCPLHDDFKVFPRNHLSGSGCPKCVKVKKLDTQNFIHISCLKHEKKYDYSLVNYVNNRTKVEIICKKHGTFSQMPKDHMSGHGCKYCNRSKGEDLIEDLLICLDIQFIREQSFDNCRGKVKPLPFDFWIPDYKIAIEWDGIQHYEPRDGFGGSESFKITQTNDRIKDEFCKQENIRLIRLRFDDPDGISNLEKLLIVEIAKHQKFIEPQKLGLDLTKHRTVATKCSETYLKPSQFYKLNFREFLDDFTEFLSQNYQGNIIYNHTVKNSTCHFFIPELGLAIKLLSLFKDSEIFVKKSNHLGTYQDYSDSGFKIIQIFEDTWVHKSPIIKSRILNLLGKSKRIGARSCEIKEVTDNTLVSKFLNNNHLQGNIGSALKLGLFYQNELVSLMTFGSLRKNLGQVSQDGHWELLRFTNICGFNVVGSASKLFSHFTKNWNVKSCISYADKCWSNSYKNIYTSLGMKYIHQSDPSYFYVVGTERKGRFAYRKDILLQCGYLGEFWQEHTICLSNGVYRIFDSGTVKYEYKPPV